MNSWELRSVGRSTDPTYALYRWTLKDVMTGLFYEIRTMVYVCYNGCMLNWLYVNTWSMIMHVNYIYDFLIGLLSICGGMWPNEEFGLLFPCVGEFLKIQGPLCQGFYLSLWTK